MKPECTHEVLFTEKYRYALGPFIATAANGDWLVTWNMSVRREEGRNSPRRYLHPPEDPKYRNSGCPTTRRNAHQTRGLAGGSIMM